MVEHRALTDEELEEHDWRYDCTGVAARWCPIHGETARPPDSGENSGWLRWMGGRLPGTLQGAMGLRHRLHILYRK